MKKFSNKKVNAGALQYTLFVSVLIVLLISTFLTLTFLQNQFKTTANFQIQSIQNATIGFQFISENDIPYEEEKTIELSADIDSRIILTKKHWGVFDVLNVQSKVKNTSFQKTGLIGGFQTEKPALYLKDNNNALVLVGNTKVEGKSFLPKNGVKRGNIAGHSYYGNQLIYGTTTQSSTKLPTIKNKDYIEQLSNGFINDEDAFFIELNEGLKIINSFNKPTQIYRQQGVVNLRDIQLTGNIIIQSDTLIKVDKTALLSDVLLIAPNIEITNQVTGNFQGFATKNIYVGLNCDLSYPTALILYEKTISTLNNNKEFPQLKINPNSSIKGVIAFLSENETANYKPQIILEENTEIIGEVYCDKNFELKGKVYGSVYTSGFIANQYGSVYQNHIYNGEIIEPNLPKQYVGLALENTKQTISKWLY